MPSAPTVSPLSELAPRTKLTTVQISTMLEDMRASLRGAHALDFFKRMEQNHDMRFCWWPGQTADGRKWPAHERSGRLRPGELPSEDIFPWPGGSDTRVRLIDEVIRERNTFKRLALQRRQETVAPRDLSPDEDPQMQAAVLGRVMNLYDDTTRWEQRTAAAQWSDIAEEYGHGVLFVGWKSDAEVIKKEITAEDLMRLVTSTAVQLAQESVVAQHLAAGGSEEDAPELNAEETNIITQDAAARLQDMIADDAQRTELVKSLLSFDDAMPKAEANRVAKDMRLNGQPVTYYATRPMNEQPVWRALTPFVDVFYPATTTRLCDAPWIAMTEWLSQAELESKVETEDWDAAWVAKIVEKGPGRSIDLTGLSLTGHSWLLSNGSVRCGVRDADPLGESGQNRYQLLHVFYRASAIGGARALYHTVLHGHVPEMAGFHGCAEHAHGQYPFFEHLTEITAPYLLASRGAGELTDTYVNEIKVQRDMRCDLASITIKPPMKVPFNQQGTGYDWLRPGGKVQMRSTAGAGLFEPIKLDVDPRGSQEVEMTTLDAFNGFWVRGQKVEAEVKMAARQVLVTDYLEDVLRAKASTFALIQQFASEEIKAAFIGGLNVQLNTTRDAIQGRVALELDYDVSETDMPLMEKRVNMAVKLMGIDNAANVIRPQLLRALCAGMMPSYYKLLLNDPDQKKKSESKEEQDIAGSIVSGTQFDEPESYVEGTDHATRLQVLQSIFGVRVDEKGEIQNMQPLGKDGQPSRAQRIFSEDPDVQERIANRFKFHTHQIKQQQNAATGRAGVAPVTQEQ